MKIKDIIIEHQFPHVKTHVRKNPPDLYDYSSEHDDNIEDYEENNLEIPANTNPTSNPEVNMLGQGAFATAYQHKKNPYDVTKASKVSYEPDGFEAFFIALSKDENAQANPYFPRFRTINRFIDPKTYHLQHRSSYMVKVEPLKSLKTLSNEEKEFFLHKLFTDIGIEMINDRFKWNKLGAGIRSAIRNRGMSEEIIFNEIKDEQFKEAAIFLNKLAREKNYDLDVHDTNIMVRRTSVGPQLVINDPLGYSTQNEF